MTSLNETHHPELKSWLHSANQPGTDFPIQNLPFALFRHKGCSENFRGGVAIGDQIVDLSMLVNFNLFSGLAQTAVKAGAQNTLKPLMAMDKTAWSVLRHALSRALRKGAEAQSQLAPCLVPQSEAQYALPCQIGDYTDFYTSIHHAHAVGSLFRPDNPLLPNYKWVPVGYHGRASSIKISGQCFPRPLGQIKTPEETQPQLAPCKRLDYEMEMGIFIGSGNPLGERININNAEDYLFGLCLLNDWSARDIQAWEYQPLGPFLAKSFATTLSPWIITTEALAPYRSPFSHPPEDPQPLPYLSSETNSQFGSFDIQLQVQLETEKTREEHQAPLTLSESNYKHAYWTPAQMISHHTVNGCNLQAGDLFGSGTQSGPTPEQAGSLLELSNGGKETINLSNGETRIFLEDGDTVIMRAFCERKNTARIGFGELIGTVLPAKD